MAKHEVKKEPRWMKLDNAAKIYPTVRSRRWTALFRVSATLDQPVDPEILAQAQRAALKRFPTFRVRLGHGLFWYYLERIPGAPEIQQDVSNPCVRMNLKENGGFMFRVRYFENRIAVEIFHVLTDGTGGLSFLLTLVAEYLRISHGIAIPRDDRILDCTESPQPDQLEDAFLRFARDASRPNKEAVAFQLQGTDEPRAVIHLTTGMMNEKSCLELAHKYKCTLTELLASVMILSADEMQRQKRIPPRKYKPIKICVPVNLRKFYGNRTLRNFSSYVNPGIEPRLGKYTLEETVQNVSAYMRLEATEKMLNAKFSGNVKSERNKILRLSPLFIKKIAMRTAYRIVGDRQYTSSISNLGKVVLPPEMEEHVQRLDFILGPLQRTRVCAACVSYKGNLIVNFTRTIKEPTLERGFFTRLVKLGLPVKIESNQRW